MAPSDRPSIDGWRDLGRRQLLQAGTGLLSVVLMGAASGCTPSDPRVDGSGQTWSPSASPSGTPATPAAPVPTPPAVLAAALSAERNLHGLAAAILAGRHRAALSADQRTLLTALVSAHQQHAAALIDPDPTARTLPSASTSPSVPRPPGGFAKLKLADSLTLLTRQETSQATRQRANALSASGFTALLYGSLSVAASSYAAALKVSGAVPTATSPKAHLPMTAVTDVAAVQSMVRQQHALVYGYQLALGQLSATSPSGRRALASLKAHRELRDRLTKVLLARGASVPAAAGAYVPTVNPTTAGRSARLIRSMEVALQPFCGLWLASGTKPADRELALDTLLTTVATARSWNAPLTVWPGWQD